MNIIENFETTQIENKNLENEFQLIIKTITLANSKQVMEKQLKNYINYLASKVGVDFKVNVLEEEFFNVKKEDFVETDLKNNVVNINKELFEVKTVKGFANSARKIAEAVQHLKINKLGNYYSTENQNGFRGEYSLHLDDITAISKFINENTMFDMADKNLFRVRTKAIRFIDDEISTTRQFGITSQLEIFESLDQMGVLKNYCDEKLQGLKDKAYRKELEKMNTYKNSLAETKLDSQVLMEKIKNVAMVQNNQDVILHLADLMDVSDFYSPKCFYELQKFAQKSGDEKLLAVLENCKQNNKVITAPKRDGAIVYENSQIPTPVESEIPKENYIKNDKEFSTYFDDTGREITKEITVTEPYKDIIRGPSNKKQNEKKRKIFEDDDEFIVEEREEKLTSNGKTVIEILKNKTDESIYGLTPKASKYVRNIWKDKKEK